MIVENISDYLTTFITDQVYYYLIKKGPAAMLMNFILIAVSGSSTPFEIKTEIEEEDEDEVEN